MSKLRVGIIGCAHMHIQDLVKDFIKRPEVFEWVGIADTPWAVTPLSDQKDTRRNVICRVMEMCGIEKAFGDWHEVLACKPDLILLTSENSRHCEIACEAMRGGSHVIMEKPMATSYADAVKMVEVAKETGRIMIVNWPSTWDTAIRTAWRLLHEGVIGRPLKFHYRNSESLGPFSYGQTMTGEEMRSEWWYQPELGGGATWDYIGYGNNLAAWFLGTRADEVFAIQENFMSDFAPEADDYSAAMLRFPGAVAHLEGSWATRSQGDVPYGPVIFGEKGTIVTHRPAKVHVFTERHNTTPQMVVEADPMPEGREDLAAEFLHHLNTGEPLHGTLSMEVNLNAMAAIEAALRSAKSGKMEKTEK